MNNYKLNPNIFIVQIIFQSKKYFFPWDANSQGLMTYNNGVLFETEFELLKRDNIPEKSLDNNHITIYDLDKLSAENGSIYSSPNCEWLIDIWNFFSDFFSITKQDFIGDNTETSVSELYDKLFYGCNLLIAEKDKYYYPNWKSEDITLLKKVMFNGVENFAKWVNCTGNGMGGQSGSSTVCD